VNARDRCPCRLSANAAIRGHSLNSLWVLEKHPKSTRSWRDVGGGGTVFPPLTRWVVPAASTSAAQSSHSAKTASPRATRVPASPRLTSKRQSLDTAGSALTGRHQPAAREHSHLFALNRVRFAPSFSLVSAGYRRFMKGGRNDHFEVPPGSSVSRIPS
jgi:hypothetical protein